MTLANPNQTEACIQRAIDSLQRCLEEVRLEDERYEAMAEGALDQEYDYMLGLLNHAQGQMQYAYRRIDDVFSRICHDMDGYYGPFSIRRTEEDCWPEPDPHKGPPVTAFG